MKIIQIARAIQKGDGVGNVVFELDRMIQAEGYDTEIWDEELEDFHLRRVSNDSLILYHMSDVADPFIQHFPCRKIMVFHNITYPEFYSWYDENERNRLAWGWYELRMIKGYFEGAIVFSEFSKKCLVEMGWDPSCIHVIPILLRFDKFRVDPNKEIIDTRRNSNTNILFTGRINPNKKQEDIIESFAIYKKEYCNKAKLFLIGGATKNKYYQMLSLLIEEKGLQGDIVMPGFTSLADYIAYYKVADVFLCMSAHEGFCIPLVEAMFFNVPIVAVRGTAIIDTLGEAGLVLDTRNPEDIARELNNMVCDERLRQKVITRQNERLQELLPDVLEPAYGKLLNEIINAGGIPIYKKDNYKRIQIPKRLLKFSRNDDFRKNIDGKIIICGAGKCGMELKTWFSDEKKTTDLVLCDSDPKKSKTKQGVMLMSDAADKYREGVFIISVQNWRSVVEIYNFLISVNIPNEKIFLYDAEKGDFK